MKEGEGGVTCRFRLNEVDKGAGESLFEGSKAEDDEGPVELERLRVIESGLGLGLEDWEAEDSAEMDGESVFSFLTEDEEEDVLIRVEEELVLDRFESSGLLDIEDDSSLSLRLDPLGEAVDLVNPSSFLKLIVGLAFFFSLSFSFSSPSSFFTLAFGFAFSFTSFFGFFPLLPLDRPPALPVESAGLGPFAGGIGLASLLRLLGKIFGLGTRLDRSGASKGSSSSS